MNNQQFDQIWNKKEITAAKATDAAVRAAQAQVSELAFAGTLTGVGAHRANFVREVISAAFDVPMEEIDALIYRFGVESQLSKMVAIYRHLQNLEAEEKRKSEQPSS